MSREIRFTVGGVRCFGAEQSVPLRPLTLLVGENSSGKTTFLAMIDAICDRSRFPFSLQLNHEPFELGTVKTVSHRPSKRNTDPIPVVLGWKSQIRGAATPNQIRSIFVANAVDHFGLESLDVEFAGHSFTVSLDDGSRTLVVQSRSGGATIEKVLRDAPQFLDKDVSALIVFAVLTAIDHNISDETELFRALRAFEGSRPESSVALSPIRMRPRRTYDQHAVDFSPEGRHVPATLARALHPDSSKATNIAKALEDFGERTGLFKSLQVKRLGKSALDPFQLQVKTAAQQTNLIDVGYGVSQSVPIVVELAKARPGQNVLIQQPEVHLHPKAQAGLGTVFAELAAREDGPRLVVETHSDYLVDRVRYEIAQGTIKAQDVSLLFFDKPKRETTIHQIELDDMGNVIDPPKSYRQFFSEELGRMFERGSTGCA